MIAWLWARTVKSPNPAFAQVDVPLASTFMLSTKAGKEAYVEPVIENGGYRFTVKVGKPKDAEAAKNGTKLARGANFQCLMSGTPIAGDYIKAEGKAGRMGARLMAIVAEGERGRVYLAADAGDGERRATGEAGVEAGCRDCSASPRGFRVRQLRPDDLRRPLHPPPARGADDLLRPGAGSARAGEARRPRCRPVPTTASASRDGGTGATAYAEAVAVYLGVRREQGADYRSSLCTWQPNTRMDRRNTFRSTGDSDDVGLCGSESFQRFSPVTGSLGIEHSVRRCFLH